LFRAFDRKIGLNLEEQTMNAKEEGEEPLIRVLEVAGNAIVGGMERYVYNLARHLPEHRFKITCLTPYESPFTASLRELGSDVYITAMGDDPVWRSIQFTAELVNQLQIDLIHAHLPRAQMLAGLVGKITNIPVVATIHGMDISSLEIGICRLTGSHLTVVCQEAYSQALAVGVPEERLTLIPNGVDTKTFAPSTNRDWLRKKLGISEDAPLVGFVGRLAWEKGPDQFVQMAEYIHRLRPDVHFVIIGEGPMEEEIDDLIKRARMKAYIHRTGLLEKTWEVFSALDVLALPSRVEGMPFAILEAMSCGIPVAAMAVGGVAEIIEVGTTGYLSASGDWAGLGDAVMKTLAEPERRKAMGRAGRNRVETLFDLRRTTRLTVNLFRKLVTEHASRNVMVASSWPIGSRKWEPANLTPSKRIEEKK
jgi:glycosyltransferase involved in cell wall biosynthesis